MDNIIRLRVYKFRSWICKNAYNVITNGEKKLYFAISEGPILIEYTSITTLKLLKSIFSINFKFTSINENNYALGSRITVNTYTISKDEFFFIECMLRGSTSIFTSKNNLEFE